MISSRPTMRRRLLAGLVPLLLALGVLPLMAPTCGTMQPGPKTFARRSLIIPMDLCYQAQDDEIAEKGGYQYQPVSCPQGRATGDAIKGYGLVYQLVRAGVPVYWVINPAKTGVADAAHPDLKVEFSGGTPVVYWDWQNHVPSVQAPTSGHVITYMGGPFVIDGSDVYNADGSPGLAVQILTQYLGTFWPVNVHVSNVAFQGTVAKVMAGGWTAGGNTPPKLALLDIASKADTMTQNAQPVLKGYLERAGLNFAGSVVNGVALPAAGGVAADGKHGAIYDALTMEDFQAKGGDWHESNLYKFGYQVLWIPHWAAKGSCRYRSGTSGTCDAYSWDSGDVNVVNALTSINAFVTTNTLSGKPGDVFAECAGIGSLEGVFSQRENTSPYNSDYTPGVSTTPFQTTGTAGFWRNKWPQLDGPIEQTDATVLRQGFNSPLMQIGDFPFRAVRGAIQDYKPVGYQADVVRLISDATYPDYDIFTMRPASGNRGTVVYLGGHSYSGAVGGSYASIATIWEVSGARLVLNTLFNLGAACVTSGAVCNTGELGVCSAGTMQCVNGAPQCVRVTGPTPETCDGLDNDCNGLVDDGLDKVCYDGAAGTEGKGICHAGLKSCVLRNNTYQMSECVGEVIQGTETCNGLDDNCDGTIDNIAGTTSPLEGACYTGGPDTKDLTTGQPRAVCKAGVTRCRNGVWDECPVCRDDGHGVPYQNPSAYPKCQILPLPQDCTADGLAYNLSCTEGIDTRCQCTDGSTPIHCYDGRPGTEGVGLCHGGARSCQDGAWGACQNQVVPQARDCSSHQDNDCNGYADDDPNDPTWSQYCGQQCPPETDEARICRVTGIVRIGDPVTGTPQGMCKDGVRSCANGVVGTECTGLILAAPETCDGKDNDCDGEVDENPETLCNAGFTCYDGICVPATCSAEVRCGEGLDCTPPTGVGTCERGECPPNSGVYCTTGETCSFARCVDPCEGKECAEGATCSSGACSGGGCYQLGCDVGQACVGGACVPDPCANVGCPVGTFCRGGDCVQSCVYVSCPAGDRCSEDGFCEPDLCADKVCGADQICVAGECQTNLCAGKGCGPRQLCTNGLCDGQPCAVCEDDPCNVVSCPVGSCTEGQCYPVAERDTSEPGEISTGGSSSSGGCGCGTGSTSALSALLFLLLVPLARRRRAPAEAGRPFRAGPGGRGALMVVAGLLALTTPACSGKGGDGSSSIDLSKCTNTCDGENRCIDLNFDPAHCGTCSTVCDADQICRDGACGPSTSVAPYLTGLAPKEANNGSLDLVPVTLTGERFQANAGVRVVTGGGSTMIDPSRVTYLGATQLQVQLDLSEAPVSSLDLRVVNPDNVISNPQEFRVVSAGAVLTDVTPGSVTAGTVTDLIVSGSGFTTTSLCHVGTETQHIGLTTHADAGPGKLRCTFDSGPFQPGTYQVWVRNGSTDSNTLDIGITPAEPHLTGLSPSSATVNSYPDLHLTGSGFDVTSRVHVRWNNGAEDNPSPATTLLDANHLMVPGYLILSGNADVWVVNGGTMESEHKTLIGIDNPPTVSSLVTTKTTPTPPTAPTPAAIYQGDTNVYLVFSGTNFSPVAEKITISDSTGYVTTLTRTGGTVSTYTAGSPNMVVGTIASLGTRGDGKAFPQGEYKAYVTFGSGASEVSSAQYTFRVLSNKAVAQSLSPTAARQGTSNTLTVKAVNVIASGVKLVFKGGGVNLLLDATATPSGTAGVYNVATNAPLSLAGRNTGVYTVAVRNSGAADSNQLSFSVMPGEPDISPTSLGTVKQCSCTPQDVVITGTNFAQADAQGRQVSQLLYQPPGDTAWYPVPGTFTVNSATKITASVNPCDAVANQTYKVIVRNPIWPTPSSGSKTIDSNPPGTLTISGTCP